MSRVKMRKAEQAFLNKEYDRAFRLYSQEYIDNRSNDVAKVGVLLSDFANEYEDEAQALYDYYTVAKEENEAAEEIIEDIIKNYDGNSERIVSLVSELMSYDKHAIDGIMYDDFKKIVANRGSFKHAFEDLMYSTKVVFEEKDDLLEFVDTLVDNGYKDMALSYLEDTSFMFAYDNRVQEIVQKLKLKDWD